jgi:hypothetical protein
MGMTTTKSSNLFANYTVQALSLSESDTNPDVERAAITAAGIATTTTPSLAISPLYHQSRSRKILDV